ncbi:P-loop containing nucleoside triphosphate hydrolase protein [Neofusicoccum parvum]|uniref:P-loop containing nucleoside triphosphate hydrolase protein, partial n=1 Tax=Neofusicoccum parvum TaxID=310453 RepID=A0ACB5SQ19_9PEZI|nr:P-loop containing nucleoside triphosphate hydrolase protein [Neofusicoccum parvum]
MKERYSKLGISCTEWDVRRPPDAESVVLVTPEAALSDEFITFLNRLRAMRQLDRIVIDEYHVVLNDQVDFRKQLQQLGKLIAAETVKGLVDAGLFQYEAFYSDMLDARKKEVLEDFKAGVVRVVVATSALGMGIDVPDIRLIIHTDEPRDLLDYA